jgi:peroxiredoxin
MRTPRATLLPLLAVAVLASCTARSGSAAPLSIEAVNALVEKAGLDQPTSTIIAGDFALETLDGKKVSLSSYKGQVVLLSFWATWCGPCKQEMPEMQTLYDNLKSRGLTVVAVDVMEDKDTVSRFVKENKYTFPVLLDTNGSTAGSSMYGVSAIPTNYVIDRTGRIVGRAVGIGGPTWMSSQRVSLFESLLKH